MEKTKLVLLAAFASLRAAADIFTLIEGFKAGKVCSSTKDAGLHQAAP